MYKLTLVLFSFFSLALPSLAVPAEPVPARDGIADGLETREHTPRHTLHTGKAVVLRPLINSMVYCIDFNHEKLPIVALSRWIASLDCGRRVRIYYGGKQVEALATDECLDLFCFFPHDLAMSSAVYQQLGVSEGKIEVQWEFVEGIL